MSHSLDKALDELMKAKEHELFKEDAQESNRDEMLQLTKEALRQMIYAEIKEEVRDDALKEAEEINREREMHVRIREYKKLMLEGLLVAFLVGLLVNQVTDMIAFYKGTLECQSIWQTFIIALVMLGFCIITFWTMFISEAVKVLGKDRNNERD